MAAGSWGQAAPRWPGGGGQMVFLGLIDAPSWSPGVGVGTQASTVLPYTKPAFTSFLLLLWWYHGRGSGRGTSVLSHSSGQAQLLPGPQAPPDRIRVPPPACGALVQRLSGRVCTQVRRACCGIQFCGCRTRGPAHAGCPCCWHLLTFFLTLSLWPLQPQGSRPRCTSLRLPFLPALAKLSASPSFRDLVSPGSLILWFQGP